MKGIKICGECANYDYKKHRCKAGAKMETDARAPFYDDCPLTEVVPAPRWISVTERLPEDEGGGKQRGFYLVALSNGVVKELAYEYHHYDNMLFEHGWHETAYPVTHWMLMPQAPKGDA